MVGKSAKAKDFSGGERVVDFAGFDEVGVDLSEVSHGSACCDLREERRWVSWGSNGVGR